MLDFDKIAQTYEIPESRSRAASAISPGSIVGYSLSSGVASATIESVAASLSLSGANCGCRDWRNGCLLEPPRLCKHLAKLAELASSPIEKLPGELEISPAPEAEAGSKPESEAGSKPESAELSGSIPRKSSPKSAPSKAKPGIRASAPQRSPFQELLRAGIAKAIESQAQQLAREIAASDPDSPILLLGPSGTAKTSAINRVASLLDCGLEWIGGTESWADSDLVGFASPTTGERLPGLISRAFARARAGENVLIFADELLRFNSRALDIFMRAIQPLDRDTARRTGIDCSEAVFVVESPLWGVESAPASRIAWIAAGNPWGIQLDPAFVRRWELKRWDFDPAILKPLDTKARDVIQASWGAVRDGILPLALEYQQIGRMQSPDDLSILSQYTIKLETLDPASAQVWRDLCSGFGVIIQ